MDASAKIVLAAMTILIGIILTGVIATQNYAKVSKTAVINETINIASARNSTGSINESVRFYPVHFIESASGWRYDDEYSDDSGCSADDLTTKITATNLSGTALTDPTDLVRVTSGYVTFKNNVKLNGTGTSNITYFSYLYCPEDYLTQRWSRSVINMVVGFMALLILIIGVYYFYDIFKEVSG